MLCNVELRMSCWANYSAVGCPYRFAMTDREDEITSYAHGDTVKGTWATMGYGVFPLGYTMVAWECE